MSKRMQRAISILVVLCIGLASLAATPLFANAARNYRTVRVHLKTLGAPSIKTFTPYGNYQVDGTGVLLPVGIVHTLSVDRGKLVLTNALGLRLDLETTAVIRRYSSDQPRVYNSLLMNSLSYGDCYYPGNLVVTASGEAMQFISVIEMEEYLYGVVPSEIGESAAPEVQKAQAICARTFTIYSMDTARADASYDLNDTEESQVYRGHSAITPKCDKAVDDTAGQYVSYGGKAIYAAYSSSNGGMTETNYGAWGTELLPYTQVKDDPWDGQAPSPEHYRCVLAFPKSTETAFDAKLLNYIRPRIAAKLPTAWTAADAPAWSIAATTDMQLHTPLTAYMTDPERCFTKADVTFTVTRNAPEAQSVSITVTLELRASGGLREEFATSNMRMLKSESTATAFNLILCRPGHGIGLSQSGAMAMAKAGWTCQQILDFYYKNVTISTLADPGLPPAQASGLVHQTGVVLRELPDVTATALMNLPQGAVVEVLGRTTDNYAKIEYSGYIGYIPMAALTIQTATQQGVPLYPARTNVLGGLNLYLAPAYTAAVRCVMPYNSVVEVYRWDEWAYICYNGNFGYAPSALLDQAMGPVAGTAPSPSSALVIVADASLYSEPNEFSSVVTLVPHNAVVTVQYLGEWCYVTYGQYQGYLARSAIETRADLPTPNISPAPPKAPMATPANLNRIRMVDTKSDSWLNLREGPGTQFAVMAKLPNGAQVEILEELGDWYKVRYGGMEGYVSAQYITDNPAFRLYAQNNAPGNTGLVLRVTADEGAAALATIPKNARFEVLEWGTLWNKVAFEGKVGYVKNENTLLLAAVTGLRGDVDGDSIVDVQDILRVRAYMFGMRTPTLQEAVRGDVSLDSAIDIEDILLIRQEIFGLVNLNGPNGEIIRVTTPTPVASGVTSVPVTPTPVPTTSPIAPSTEAPTTLPTAAPVPANAMANWIGGVNLRSAPDVGATALLVIPSGARLTVVAQIDGWYQVKYNDNAGYCLKEYIMVDNQPTATVTAIGGLRLRQGPGTTYAIITTIPQGATVEVESESGDWCKVKYQQMTGYVSKQYLQFTSIVVPVQTPAPPTPTPAPVYYRVNSTSGLFLRAAADSEATILAVMPHNARVQMLSYNTWCYVSYNGTKGYCSRAYLEAEA